MRARMIRSGYL